MDFYTVIRLPGRNRHMSVLYFYYVELCFSYVLVKTVYVITILSAKLHSPMYVNVMLRLCQIYLKSFICNLYAAACIKEAHFGLIIFQLNCRYNLTEGPGISSYHFL